MTPEVAGAWDELFWLMADMLVSLESDLYRSAGVSPLETCGGRSR